MNFAQRAEENKNNERGYYESLRKMPEAILFVIKQVARMHNCFFKCSTAYRTINRRTRISNFSTRTNTTQSIQTSAIEKFNDLRLLNLAKVFNLSPDLFN